MRLIDADVLKENMRGEFIDSVEERIAIREIDSAPSIDIVRCRECRWQSVITDEEEGTLYYMCGVWAMPTDEDVFCSHGKRNE